MRLRTYSSASVLALATLTGTTLVIIPKYAKGSMPSFESLRYCSEIRTDYKPFYAFLPQFERSDENKTGDLIRFHLSKAEVDNLINASINIINSGQVGKDNCDVYKADSIGKRIKFCIDQLLIHKFPNSKIGKFERQWAVAEAVCEFVKRSVSYSVDIAKSPSAKHRTEMSLSDKVLKNGYAECWGFATTTRDIARAAGLECYLVNGHKRELGGSAPDFHLRNHSINCFVFENGLQIPADVTAAALRYFGRAGKEEFGGSCKVLSHLVLPRDRTSWDIFMAKFNSETDLEPNAQISGDVQNKFLIATYNYEAWAGTDTSYLVPMEARYVGWEKSKKSN